MDAIAQLADEELIELIQKHNQKAFKALHKRYSLSLFRFAQQILKEGAQAEEVVSDVFVNLWLKRKELVIHTSVKSYLFVATKNQALKSLRKSQPEWEDIESWHATADLSISSTTEQALVYQDLYKQVEEILAQLPPQRQLVFRMHRLEGFSYKEIAEILSISVKTVQNHMVQAIKQLAQYYPQFESMFWLIYLFQLSLGSSPLI